MLSREAGTIAYGTRMVEQDRINLSVQVDLGNCSQEAYTPTTDVTALTDDVIWFENNFYIPTGVTTFTFTDGTTDMVATLDGTWSFDVDGNVVAYTASGSITEISDGVTFDTGNFTVPTGVTEFDFKDDSYKKTGKYDAVSETWEWLHWLASADGNTSQTWKWKLPLDDTIIMHWGDGNSEEIVGTGSDITVTHDYLEAGDYDIKVSGDYVNTQRLELNTNGLSGDVDQLSIFSNAQYMYYQDNSMTGSIDRFGNLTSILFIYGYGAGNAGIIGSVANLATMTSCSRMYLYGPPNFSLSGDASALRTLPASARIYLQFNNINGLQFNSQEFWNNDGAQINLSSCNLSSTDVDNALIAFAGDGTTHVSNSTITLGGNATRTSASDAAVAAITDPVRGNTLDIT
jgi:hypothetical protein